MYTVGDSGRFSLYAGWFKIVQRVNCLHIILVMIHVVLVNRELKWGDN